MRPGIDRTAISNGVITIIAFGVPLALVAGWAGRTDRDGVALAANLAVLGVFVLGSGLAAWVQRNNTPLAHGLVTAIAAQVILSLIAAGLSLIRDTNFRWFTQLALLGLALGCGLVGGVVGGRLRQSGNLPSTETRPLQQPRDSRR